MKPLVLAVALLLGAAASTAAQSTYVAGAISADVVRFSGAESEGDDVLDNNGGALSFAVRAGTPVGDRWGVEAEFARSGGIENELEPSVISLPQLQMPRFASPGLAISWTSASAVPFQYSVRTTQRTTTIAASAWLRHDLTSRVALVYVAGMGFFRSEYDYENSLDFLPLRALLTIPALRTETVTYGVKPLAGVESRVRLLDHVDLVPGVRLQGLEGGWLVRPSIGAAWNF